MAISVRIKPIGREIEVMLKATLSPEAQSAIFAEYAGEQIENAKQINKQVFGQVPAYTVWVDGKQGAPLSSVKVPGTVIAEFDLQLEALEWIEEKLLENSPIESGRFRKSHKLFADDQEVQFGADIPMANEYVFINEQPYARKIERGQGTAPKGLFEALAVLAAQRFGNTAKIFFTFRSLLGGPIGEWAQTGTAAALARRHKRRKDPGEWLTRQPAIIVRRLTR